MLFLARKLHMPTGELLRNMVVRVEGSCVKDIYSFVGEVHSMALVDELFLSDLANLKKVAEIKKVPYSGISEELYAYKQDTLGELVLLG